MKKGPIDMESTDTVKKTQANMARSTVMTDTQEQDTNAITRQPPEELSEQDMQAINGGAKFGNPQAMLEEALGPFSPSSGIGRMDERAIQANQANQANQATGKKRGWSTASKAEVAAIGTGSATSFTVGFGAMAIENKL
jgi:hypothetical protein